MGDLYIVEAVRSPLGKRGGGLSTVHAADLLGHVRQAAVEGKPTGGLGTGTIIERLD